MKSNQIITVQVEGVDIACSCHVAFEQPMFFDNYPGYFECTVENIEIGGVDVTELITEQAPGLFKQIEELCTENADTN